MTSSEPRGKNEKEVIWVQTDIFSLLFKIVATAFKAPFYLSKKFWNFIQRCSQGDE